MNNNTQDFVHSLGKEAQSVAYYSTLMNTWLGLSRDIDRYILFVSLFFVALTFFGNPIKVSYLCLPFFTLAILGVLACLYIEKVYFRELALAKFKNIENSDKVKILNLGQRYFDIFNYLVFFGGGLLIFCWSFIKGVMR